MSRATATSRAASTSRERGPPTELALSAASRLARATAIRCLAARITTKAVAVPSGEQVHSAHGTRIITT